MQRHWSLYLLAFALLPGLLARPAISQQVRPLVELSRPNAVGSCDTGFYTYGNWPVDETHEPIVAVNPVHPNNVVAAWTQGPFQDIIAAVSLDGGESWHRVPIPLTVCSGGSFVVTGDPWISFAPNGELYVVAGAGHTPSDFGIVVIKSGDGGLHWSAPLMVPESRTPDPHASLTADPKDARFVYVLWHNLFSRTTDGGLTWEPARTIEPEKPQTIVQFSKLCSPRGGSPRWPA
jgi:hypothetical protein